MTGLDACGHIDVKVPSKGRKFGQWKAWRKQWCVVRSGEDNSIQLVLGNGHNSPTSCIDIPYNAVLCRSESRSRMFAFGIFCPSSVVRLRQPIIFLAGRSETESQKWILRIRNLISQPSIPVVFDEFSVSLIDNPHSRRAGLAGLYGSLRTGLTGVTVRDPCTGQVRVHWRWPQLDGASLRHTSVEEDQNHVLVIHTSSEFSCGEGELHLFCLEGVNLEAALTRYQARPQFRLTSSPLPPLPSFPHHHHALLAARRLSHSEGDLRCWPDDTNFALFHLRTQSMSQSRNNSSQDKVASSIVTAGLGLMLTTPGCSEPDSLHDYQCLDSRWPEDTVSDLPRQRHYTFPSTRRESGVSIASGIYEEIQERPGEWFIPEEPAPSPPPPLPPRKQEPSGSEEDFSVSEQSLIYSVAEEKDEEEPLYLPMSPSSRKEDTYVVMANLLNKSQIPKPVV